MGPRRDWRGYEVLVVSFRQASLAASMGPRRDWRGYYLSVYALILAAEASMGPRRDWRGYVGALKGADAKGQALQWGHAVIGVDT